MGSENIIVNSHYDRIAKNFNKSWNFSNEYKEWAVKKIDYYLELKENDIFVDIGGGTGTFTNMIFQYCTPKKAYCVEPEKKMCEIAKEHVDIKIVCSNALSFINNIKYKFNKILLKEVIHHIDDRDKLWSDIYRRIGKNGIILIYTRPRKIHFPLFEKAKQEFYKNQPGYKMLVSELKKNGFKVNVNTESFTFTLQKQEWHDMIKAKFMSDLSIFSTKEILRGINEIERKYHTDTYEIKDEIIFISAYK